MADLVFRAWRRAVLAALTLGLLSGALALSRADAQIQSRLPAQGFADIAERLMPAVVNIATRQHVEGVSGIPQFPRGSPFERFNNNGDSDAQITSLGSGFLISGDGYVVTNNHVIADADFIDVILQTGVTFDARVVGRDPATDIALLKIESPTPLPFVVMGDSDSARVGDLVLAIGNPFGLGGSVSAGIVSARNRNIDAGRYDDFIQTDAAINRGNSGGPLFNLSGEVIGVNTAIVTSTGESVGVGFATPTSIVRPVIDQLRRYGETRRGWLGVRLSTPQPGANAPAGGALITRVTPGGPAASAGLREGDVVVSFDGKDVRDARALTRMVGDAAVGASVPVDILRGGRRQTLNVVIARLQEPSEAPRVAAAPDDEPDFRRDGGPRGGRIFGLSVSELDEGLRAEFQIEPSENGLVVLSIDPSSSAAGAFRPGDVIDRIGPAATENMEAARAIAARAAAEARPIVVRIRREGKISYRVLRPPRPL